MIEPKEIKITDSDEEEVFKALRGMGDQMREFREAGQNVISSLAFHILQKYRDYISIKDMKDLQVTLEFLGMPMLVKVEIPLPFHTEKGKINAYRLLEKEKDKLGELLLSVSFDKIGNINRDFHFGSFPLYFFKRLIGKLKERDADPLISGDTNRTGEATEGSK